MLAFDELSPKMSGKSKKRKTRSSGSSVSDKGQNNDQTNDQPGAQLSDVITQADNVLYRDNDDNGTGDSGDNQGNNIDMATMVKLFTESQAKHEDTNKKLDSITQKLNKLDSIELKLSQLENNITTLGMRVDSIERKNKELEDSASFVSNKFDTESKRIDTLSKEIKAQIKNQEKTIADIDRQVQKVKVNEDMKAELKRSKIDLKRHEATIETLSRGVENLRRDRNELQDRVTDLQCRSMKMNLVFTGLGKEQPREDTESKLRSFLDIELGIDSHVEFANVHRFGRHVRGRSRPIVARFIYQHELDRVLDNAYQLRGSPYGIRQQFPAAVEDRRRTLYPIMRQHKAHGANVKMVRDRLYINGQLYDPDEDYDSQSELNQDDNEGPGSIDYEQAA